MRKLIFIGFIALGALDRVGHCCKKRLGNPLGHDGRRCAGRYGHWWRIDANGSRPLPRESSWLDQPHGHGTPEDELVRNYWRDGGTRHS
jgi:hypothetical protein